MTKKCSRCKKVKSVDDFYRRSEGGIVSTCKTCSTELAKIAAKTRRAFSINLTLEKYVELRKTREGRQEIRRLYGEDINEKICTGCKRKKQLTEFYIRKTGAMTGRPLPQCKDCHSKTTYRDHIRKLRLWKSYGLTEGDYERMLKGQGGKCAICGRVPEYRKLSVDHNHETGQVRGLLCDHCNHFEGWFRVHREKVLKYLDLHAQELCFSDVFEGS